MAHSVFVSPTGNRPRSSLKSSSGALVSGGESSKGGRPAPALNLGAATCTGSQTEASPTPTPTRQPAGSSEGGKTLKFSNILHVFEHSGEDFFDKEVLRDLRKSSEPSSCHEDVSKDREAVKEALSTGFYEGQGNEGD